MPLEVAHHLDGISSRTNVLERLEDAFDVVPKTGSLGRIPDGETVRRSRNVQLRFLPPETWPRVALRRPESNFLPSYSQPSERRAGPHFARGGVLRMRKSPGLNRGQEHFGYAHSDTPLKCKARSTWRTLIKTPAPHKRGKQPSRPNLGSEANTCTYTPQVHVLALRTLYVWPPTVPPS